MESTWKVVMDFTTIILVEDHRVVRQALRQMLEAEPDFRVVGEAADGLDAIALVDGLKPDVSVLDLRLPGLGGLEVTREIVQRSPKTRVVILSVYADEAHVVAALRNGATGYVPKTATADELICCIRQAVAGRRYLSPPLSERSIQASMRSAAGAPGDAFDRLTARERQVMQLVVEGYTSAGAASRLCISPRTVEMHRANLAQKLGTRNQTELIRYALRRGMLSLEDGC
jgi:DNA-binding NarL/FixJ family response regulator